MQRALLAGVVYTVKHCSRWRNSGGGAVVARRCVAMATRSKRTHSTAAAEVSISPTVQSIPGANDQMRRLLRGDSPFEVLQDDCSAAKPDDDDLVIPTHYSYNDGNAVAINRALMLGSLAIVQVCLCSRCCDRCFGECSLLAGASCTRRQCGCDMCECFVCAHMYSCV